MWYNFQWFSINILLRISIKSLFLIDSVKQANLLPKFLIHDNACHLDKILENQNVAGKSAHGAKVSEFECVIERLHIKNHFNAK